MICDLILIMRFLSDSGMMVSGFPASALTLVVVARGVIGGTS